MLPEISRRCLACGAAVRRGARFCHQCGADTERQSVAEQETKTAVAETDAATLADETPLELPEPPDTGTLVETWAQWDESMHARDERGSAASSSTAAPQAFESSSAFEPNAQVESPQPRAKTKVEKTEVEMTPPPAPAASAASAAPVAPVERGETGAESEADERAGVGRRGASAIVRENLRPRMEKMREASIVVMEEASEDTGLRFILIAVALFVLFLLFLFISSFLR